MRKVSLWSLLAVFGLVSFSGCATMKESNIVILEKPIILDDMHFEYDTDNFTRSGSQEVLRNIQVLDEYPEVKIRIDGYASASGTEEHNQNLSERRAKVVKQMLIEGGITPERLRTIGYGESRPAEFEPIPKNIDSAEAVANRRVLFEIIVK
ncbi:MAG TPA: hypothetical protein DCP53_08665 [Elusimicrobia bacterium]|nr:hypothetical protein [Elusimicrobiota bacterium]